MSTLDVLMKGVGFEMAIICGIWMSVSLLNGGKMDKGKENNDKVVTFKARRQEPVTLEERVFNALPDQFQGTFEYLKEVAPKIYHEILKNIEESAKSEGREIKDIAFPATVGYLAGRVNGTECLLTEQLENYNKAIDWLELSIKNRFNLPDDDELIQEIQDHRIKPRKD